MISAHLMQTTKTPLEVSCRAFGDLPSFSIRFGDYLDHVQVSVDSITDAIDLMRRLNQSFRAALEQVRRGAEGVVADVHKFRPTDVDADFTGD